MRDRAEYFGLDKTKEFDDFKSKYLPASLLSLNTDKTTGDKIESYTSRNIPIPEKVESYISELKNSGDYIERDVGTFKLEDIRIMAVESNSEYAILKVGTSDILIRGEEKFTNIPKAVMDRIVETHGTIEAHVHPFIGDVTPSAKDMKIFDVLTWQETSRIISVDGIISTFNKNGLITTEALPKSASSDYNKLLYELFGGE